MLFNAGSVISLGMALAILSSAIDPTALTNLFLGTQTGRSGVAVESFIIGIRLVFLISFIMTIIAAFISAFKGKAPVWKEDIVQSPQEEEFHPEAPENLEI